MRNRFLALVFGLLLIPPYSAAALVDLTAHTNLRGAYLLEQPDAHEIDVRLFIEAGEFDNTGPEGLPHYLEHLVFWSADKAHGNGYRDRTANAWTSPQWTAYWNKGASDKLPVLLQSIANVFAPINLDANFVVTEKNIVQREYDLRLADQPGYRLFFELNRQWYGNHPYGRSTIGNRESIDSVTLSQATQFKERWYQANNAVLQVSGPLTAETFIPLLRRYFSALPDTTTPKRHWRQPLRPLAKLHISRKSKALSASQVLLLRHSLATDLSADELLVATDLLQEIINSALPGSLLKPLYFDNFLTLSVDNHVIPYPDGTTLLIVHTVPADGVAGDSLVQRISKELNSLAADGVPPTSFKRVQRKRIRQLTRESKNPNTQADMLTKALLSTGKAYTTDQYLGLYRQADPTLINRLLSGFGPTSPTASGTLTRSDAH